METFINHCKEGDIVSAKALYYNNINTNIINTKSIYEGFSESCSWGHLDIAIWLYDVSNKTINIHNNKDEIFFFAAILNQLSVVKWLYDLGGFDVLLRSDIIYAICYERGHHDMIKWLTNKYSNISINKQSL